MSLRWTLLLAVGAIGLGVMFSLLDPEDEPSADESVEFAVRVEGGGTPVLGGTGIESAQSTAPEGGARNDVSEVVVVVRWDDGAPLSEAEVWADERHDLAVMTDQAGRARLPRGAGECIHARASSGAEVTSQLDVGQDRVELVVPRGHRLLGTLLDSQGVPMLGVRLDVREMQRDVIPPRTVHTDDEGRFEVVNLRAGRLRISCADHEVLLVDKLGKGAHVTVVPSEELTLRAVRARQILLHLVDHETGQPVTQTTTVQVLQPPPSFPSRSLRVYQRLGRVHLHWPSIESWPEVSVSADTYRTWLAVLNPTLRDGVFEDTVSLHPLPGAFGDVRLHVGESFGSALFGTRLTLVPSDDPEGAGIVRIPFVDDGHARISRVPAGSYDVQYAGLLVASGVSVAPNEAVRVQAKLTELVEVTLEVRSSDCDLRGSWNLRVTGAAVRGMKIVTLKSEAAAPRLALGLLPVAEYSLNLTHHRSRLRKAVTLAVAGGQSSQVFAVNMDADAGEE